ELPETRRHQVRGDHRSASDGYSGGKAEGGCWGHGDPKTSISVPFSSSRPSDITSAEGRASVRMFCNISFLAKRMFDILKRRPYPIDSMKTLCQTVGCTRARNAACCHGYISGQRSFRT